MGDVTPIRPQPDRPWAWHRDDIDHTYAITFYDIEVIWLTASPEIHLMPMRMQTIVAALNDPSAIHPSRRNP